MDTPSNPLLSSREFGEFVPVSVSTLQRGARPPRLPTVRRRRPEVIQTTNILDQAISATPESIEMTSRQPDASSSEEVQVLDEVEEISPEPVMVHRRFRISDEDVVEVANNSGLVPPWPRQASSRAPTQRLQGLGTAAVELRQMDTLVAQLRILQQRRAAERASALSSNPSTSGNTHFEECIICYEPLTVPECSVTKCGHMFHTHCILACTSSHRRNELECPICRQPVLIPELVQIHNGLPSKSLLEEGGAADSTNVERGRDGEVVVISDGEDSPARISSAQPAPDSSNSISKDVDGELLNTLRAIQLGLKKAIQKYTDGEEKLNLHCEKIMKSLKLEHLNAMVDVTTTRKKLREERREVDKRLTEVNMLKSKLVDGQKELEDKVSVFNEKKDKMDELEMSYDIRMAGLKEKEAELNDGWLKLRKKEERVEILLKAKKKRAREQEEVEEGEVTTDRQAKKRLADTGEVYKCQPALAEPATVNSDSNVVNSGRSVTSRLQKETVQKAMTPPNDLVAGHESSIANPIGMQHFVMEDVPVLPPSSRMGPPRRAGRAKGTGQVVRRRPVLTDFTAPGPKAQHPQGPIGKAMKKSGTLGKR